MKNWQKKSKKKNIDNAQKKVDDAQIAEKKVSDDGYANQRIYFFSLSQCDAENVNSRMRRISWFLILGVTLYCPLYEIMMS